ncbi:hypothetical protein BJ988_001761 [Nocardioides panzhihuensis]|uniref:Uncharacterized protein n=1 Tax=Nocardioides panzhihuensis TaxID=860243 RepID=A0A7Z0DKM4_9ACTN|nr:hypothetical protein [Nocardioides panzhihuensis]
MDPFKSAIDDMLRADLEAPRKQRHTARRIHVRLIEEHDAIEVSYSTVRDYVRIRRTQIGLEAGRRVEVMIPRSTHQAQKQKSTSASSTSSWPG